MIHAARRAPAVQQQKGSGRKADCFSPVSFLDCERRRVFSVMTLDRSTQNGFSLILPFLLTRAVFTGSALVPGGPVYQGALEPRGYTALLHGSAGFSQHDRRIKKPVRIPFTLRRVFCTGIAAHNFKRTSSLL